MLKGVYTSAGLFWDSPPVLVGGVRLHLPGSQGEAALADINDGEVYDVRNLTASTWGTCTVAEAVAWSWQSVSEGRVVVQAVEMAMIQIVFLLLVWATGYRAPIDSPCYANPQPNRKGDN